jgi:oxygen-independent coproporphyrinogen III oxidase
LTPGDPARAATHVAPPIAFYLHVPFCVSLCPYCDFVVNAGAAARGPRSRIDGFVEALLVEIGLRADAADARHGRPGAGGRPALDTVYLGGGTPSLLAAPVVARLLGAVRDRFGVARDAEVTIEVNPGPDDVGDLAGFVEAGVTRVSVGAQSLDPAELSRLGRRHRPSDVGGAVAASRAAGARSVSLDLLYDVPGQAAATWDTTLAGALALRPDHLSLYALTLDDPDAEGLTGPEGDHLPTTPGARRWRDRARADQDEDRAATFYDRASDALEAAGFRGYELSNWALPGHESRHNLAYWERRPYEAVGPGAHAFDGAERRWNAARLDAYLHALRPATGEPRLPPGGHETVGAEAAASEEAILGLRLDRGVPADIAADPRFAEAFAWARTAGLVEDTSPLDARMGGGAAGPPAAVRGPRVRLTRRGRLLSNELFARLV